MSDEPKLDNLSCTKQIMKSNYQMGVFLFFNYVNSILFYFLVVCKFFLSKNIIDGLSGVFCVFAGS